ncbi:MAG: HD domain-containing protein, partial [Rubrobacter sp.]|nr:HD domain-containing protein [Rubrobacter sp.]
MSGLYFSPPILGAALLLAAACAVSLRFQLEFGRVRVHMADMAVLTALVLLGPVWALLVAAPSMVYRDPLRVLFVSSCDAIKIISAGFVFQLFATPLLLSPQLGSSLIYGVVAAGAVFYALDALINCGLLLLKYGTPLKETLRESILPLVPSDVVSVVTVIGVSHAVVLFGPAAALVLFSGTAGALVSLHLIHERQRQNEALRAENESLLSSSLTFAGRLVESLEKRDGYTARHAAATSVYAGDIATEFGLDGGRRERLKVAALLQDVGLASVPDEVLVTPPGKLNSVGRMRLEEHPLESERVLASVPEFEEASRWVRWHHERPDGAGYPDRLRGEWIPL